MGSSSHRRWGVFWPRRVTSSRTLDQLRDQLDALAPRRPTASARAGQREVARPTSCSSKQRVGDGGMGEELDRLVPPPCQHLADGLAAQRPGLGVEALAMALVAQHLHVGRKLISMVFMPWPSARNAAALARVKLEAGRRPNRRRASTSRRTLRMASQKPIRWPGRNAGSCRWGSGRPQPRSTFQAATASQSDERRSALRDGTPSGSFGQRDVAASVDLPGRDARHRHQALQGLRQSLQVVQATAPCSSFQGPRRSPPAACSGVRMGADQALAGDRIGHAPCHGAAVPWAITRPATHARGRCRWDVDAADGVLVMLHHHQVLPLSPAGQGVEQDAVVPRVQADGGFVPA